MKWCLSLLAAGAAAVACGLSLGCGTLRECAAAALLTVGACAGTVGLIGTVVAWFCDVEDPQD